MTNYWNQPGFLKQSHLRGERQPGSGSLSGSMAGNVFIPYSPLWSRCLGNQSLTQTHITEKEEKPQTAKMTSVRAYNTDT